MMRLDSASRTGPSQRKKSSLLRAREGFLRFPNCKLAIDYSADRSGIDSARDCSAGICNTSRDLCRFIFSQLRATSAGSTIMVQKDVLSRLASPRNSSV